jgi:hypothetical protein
MSNLSGCDDYLSESETGFTAEGARRKAKGKR